MNLFSRMLRRKTDLVEELNTHLRMAVAERVARGESLENAEREALREFGNLPLVADVTREKWGWLRLENFVLDIRYALRQLRKNKGFAVTAILILSLGICANVAIFSFVDAALIKPLPYAQPTRLMNLFESNGFGAQYHLSYPDYLDWKAVSKSFSSIAAYQEAAYIKKNLYGVELAYGLRVSDGFFRTLGVHPILG